MKAFAGMIRVVLRPLPGFTGEDVVRVLERYNAHDIEVRTADAIHARIHRSSEQMIGEVAWITEKPFHSAG